MKNWLDLVETPLVIVAVIAIVAVLGLPIVEEWPHRGDRLKGADRKMTRNERRRGKLERLLLQAAEEAEQIGKPDIAEIVREALEELEHPRNNLEEHE
jgi:hypothetical protein